MPMAKRSTVPDTCVSLLTILMLSRNPLFIYADCFFLNYIRAGMGTQGKPPVNDHIPKRFSVIFRRFLSNGSSLKAVLVFSLGQIATSR